MKPESARPKVDRSQWRCFRCQKLGHIADDCPLNDTDDSLRDDVHYSEGVYMNEPEEGTIDPGQGQSKEGQWNASSWIQVVLEPWCDRNSFHRSH